MGQWRQVKNFDMLLTICGSSDDAKSYDRRLMSPGATDTRLHDLCANPDDEAEGQLVSSNIERVLRRIANIDRALEPHHRVIERKYLQRVGGFETGEGRRLKEPGEGLTDELAVELVALARQFVQMFRISVSNQTALIEKSKELFDRIVEQEKVETIKEKNDVFYLVNGLSGGRYKVARSSGSVTDMVTGNHICIVNAGARDSGGYDYLSSVVAALAYDTRSAGTVGTLTNAMKASADQRAAQPEEQEVPA
jgi:hypothetical protein